MVRYKFYRTEVFMRIRSITCFYDPKFNTDTAEISRMADLAHTASESFK